MKVCEKCGDEICTRDGDNRCPACEDNPPRTKVGVKNRAADRKAKDEAMRSLGLVKVKGAMGRTYWE